MPRIFDDAQRVAERAAHHNEPHYAYLNTTARPEFVAVRNLIEAWFDRFPRRHQTELRQRLRSLDDRHFISAFFELYLHTLLQRLGFDIQVHPPAGGRGGRPDFLVTRRSARILVEAAVVDDVSATARGSRSRLQSAFDALNTLECPDYFLHVEHHGTPRSPIPQRRLKNHVRLFLSSLDYETVRALAAQKGLDALPRTTFEHDGCHLGVSVIPVSPGHRGAPNHRPLGALMPSEAYMVDDRTPVRDKIRTKANRYGRIRRPLIVAVNAIGRHLDKMDIMEALFGREAYTLPVHKLGEVGEPQMTRIPDGVWRDQSGPRNTRISAVLVLSDLLPWTVAVTEPALYLNPWARYPIQQDFEDLEIHQPVGNQLVAKPGRAIHQILSLPERWPSSLSATPGV